MIKTKRKIYKRYICFGVIACLTMGSITMTSCSKNNKPLDNKTSVVENIPEVYEYENTISFAGINFAGSDSFIKPIDVKIDFRDFVGDKSSFNKSIAQFASVLSNNIYPNTRCKINDILEDDKTILLTDYGFEDVIFRKLNKSSVDTDKMDSTDVLLGHHQLTQGENLYEVYAICIKGTGGLEEEWKSNFDIGADDESYYSKTGEHPDWNNKNNHKGFDVTATRVDKVVQEYISSKGNQEAKKILLVTGHSRGGAIANILGAKYEKNNFDCCTYAFSSPNTTIEEDSDRKTVFNIINKDDFICCAPPSAWGYKRYGNDICVSIGNDEKLKKYMEDIKKSDYEYGLCDGIMSIFESVAVNREDAYNWEKEGCVYELTEKKATEIKSLLKEYEIQNYIHVTNEDGKYFLKFCGASVFDCMSRMVGVYKKTGSIIQLYAYINSLCNIFPDGSAPKNVIEELTNVIKVNANAFMMPHLGLATYTILMNY